MQANPKPFVLVRTLGILVLSVMVQYRSAAEVADTTASLQAVSKRPTPSNTYVRLGIDHPGIYRIEAQQLARAGVLLNNVSMQKLNLWHKGKRAPLHLSRLNGEFGPSDWIEFVGDAPRTETGQYLPQNTSNVYYLTWSGFEQVGMRYERSSALTNLPADASATFQDDRVLERDLKRVPMREIRPEVTDAFFWGHIRAGISSNVYVGIPGFDRAPGRPVEMTLTVFGASDIPSLRPSHKFEASLGPVKLGEIAFDGFRYFDLTTTFTPPVKMGERELLTFTAPSDREGVVDSIAVDRIRLSYPRYLDAAGRDLFRFTNRTISNSAPSGLIPIRGVPSGARVFSLEEQVVYYPDDPNAKLIGIRDSNAPTTYVLVSADGYYTPPEMTYVSGRGPETLAPDTEALILYHPRLKRSAEFFEKYRTSEGTKATAVDALRVFDALNHGFINDQVLKSYIRFARERAPGIKYLVLLGDGTADYRQTNYDGVNLEPVRNLIPVHWVDNPAVNNGGYYDDTWYACLSDTAIPNFAVGRIPANSEEEAFSYFTKLVEYEQLKQGRDGQLLMVSSVEKSFQDLVLQSKAKFENRFTTSTVLFPETSQAELEVSRLREAINSNTNLLYYLGHGGAFVWRVGPTDFRAQKDLFTPKDVEKLTNKGQYPVITCSSCYTTSFELYYSLGEALLFGREKGAIAVIGTPWKSTVHEDHQFNTAFFEAYTNPKTTALGDAFLHAKRANKSPGTKVDFQSFTLLGDPTLRLVRK